MLHPMDYAIEAEGLHKRFGDTHALAGVDLAARRGTVLGVLGPNGAGKTTAVRILATLLEPDGGTARVAGLDVIKEPAALRAKIGLAGQCAAVDENLTGFENLEMVGRLYHMPKADARTDLKSGGVIWLMTPKVGRDGYVDASDVAEAAPTAGLATTSSLSVTDDWSATKLVMPKGPRGRR